MFGRKCYWNLDNKEHYSLIWNWKNKLLWNSIWKCCDYLLLRKHHCCRGSTAIHLLNWKIIIGSKVKVWISTCYIYIVCPSWNGIYWPDWISSVSWIKEYLQIQLPSPDNQLNLKGLFIIWYEFSPKCLPKSFSIQLLLNIIWKCYN